MSRYGKLPLAIALVIGLAAPAGAAESDQQSTENAAPATIGPGMMDYGTMGPSIMMGGGMMGHGMMSMMAQYPDGYLAFLKTELAITTKQETAWTKFADALRTQSETMQAMHSQMASQMMGQGMTGQGMMGPHMMGQGKTGQGMGHGTMMGQTQTGMAPSFMDTLDQHIEWMSQNLQSLTALRDAAKPLYDSFSDTQKQKADQIFGCWRCGF